MQGCSLGFRVVGAVTGDRRAINWPVGFSAYAACDDRTNPSQQSFLSAFTFDSELLRRQDSGFRLNTRDYEGICHAPYLWFDIDREGDLDSALADTRQLVGFIEARYGLPADRLLVFFSGSKGFHCGLSTTAWDPTPAVDFHRCSRRLASLLADEAGLSVDLAVYDKVRLFRAPNSRHAATGLYKRRILREQLFRCEMSEIRESARDSAPFEVPDASEIVDRAVADWRKACEAEQAAAAAWSRRSEDVHSVRPYARTIAFIREGAPQGERAIRLFQAAANLAECGFDSSLIRELLREPALRSGLTAHEVRQNIENGIRRGCRHGR